MKSSKIIALSAVTAAISGGLAGVGSLLGDFDFTFFLFAGIALTLPLYYDSFWGCALSYLAGGIIALLFSGFNFISLLPYFIWFGVHPVLGCMLARKNVKPVLSFIIQLILLEIALFLVLKFTQMLVLPYDFLTDNQWIFYLAAIPIFFVYNKMIVFLVKQLFQVLSRIIK